MTRGSAHKLFCIPVLLQFGWSPGNLASGKVLDDREVIRSLVMTKDEIEQILRGEGRRRDQFTGTESGEWREVKATGHQVFCFVKR